MLGVALQLMLRAPSASAFAGIALHPPRVVCAASLPALRAPRAPSLAGFAMTNVKGVARNEDIMNVVQLAKQAMPNRPDGVVVCVQYSSVRRPLLVVAVAGSAGARGTDGGAF